MIEQETLFILGAGASRPYNYPTEIELRRYISGNFVDDLFGILKKDPHIIQKAPAKKRIEDFADTFNSSAVQSIELWLAMNPEFSAIGKIAIALCILKYERYSLFGEDIDEPSKDWYSCLYNRMIEGLHEPDDYKYFQDNKVSFISFNYDRSLEEFLFKSLCNSFVQVKIEHSIMSNSGIEVIPFPFIHVFGQIDKPHWNQGPPYGEKYDWDRITEAASNIKVIGENPADDVKIIPDLFAKAKKILILGFGFILENMEALKIPERLSGEKQVYATVQGISSRKKEELHNLVHKGFKKSPSVIVLEDMDCCQLLREYL